MNANIHRPKPKPRPKPTPYVGCGTCPNPDCDSTDIDWGTLVVEGDDVATCYGQCLECETTFVEVFAYKHTLVK